MRNVGLESKLEAFLLTFDIESICERLGNECGLQENYVKDILCTFVNETRATLSLVKNKLNLGMRILEVGAGICLFSLFLKKENYNIVALEPARGGFSDFEKISNAVLVHFDYIELTVLRISAQDLDSKKHGEFDLIFSNNVMEHIPDLSSTFSAMTNVLSQQGLMVHACPNYVIPYEPHFGIPVLKRLPGLSRYLFSRKIETNSELWDSLNFISYFEIKALATENHLIPKFVQGVAYNNLLRFETDKIFRERHMNNWFFSLFSLLKSLRVLEILRFMPPLLSTPMIIVLFHECHEPLSSH